MFQTYKVVPPVLLLYKSHDRSESNQIYHGIHKIGIFYEVAPPVISWFINHSKYPVIPQ